MTTGDDNSSVTATDEPVPRAETTLRPFLFLVLEAHHPLAPPARIALTGVDEVTFERGPARTIELVRDEDARRILVGLRDRHISKPHARLARVLRRWVLEDAGSKNGIRVNGVSHSEAALVDGDIVEIGHTFFLFREAVPCEPDTPAIVDAAGLDAPAIGLATLLPALESRFARFAAIAQSTESVIIEGETGTGKEVLARALHTLSGRRGELVAVNCGALPRDLVEGELFGHRKGAFSGATEDRPGLVRSAHQGTLFLDEIGDLPAAAQAALLRVLQEREVRPLGATRPVPVDLRVIAATHRPLDRMIAANEFRQDLLMRLAGHRFELPPLRDRLEDLGLLIRALLACRPDHATIPPFHPRAMEAFLRYRWPGNVRELGHCLGSAIILARQRGSGKIDLEHLPVPVQRAFDESATARETADATLREELITLLRRYEGNITAVAKHMDKGRTQVQRWLNRSGIHAASYRR